jgi:peptidoglycan hydrolase CwlO-like protein
LIKECSLLSKIHEDAEDANFASFSKLRVKIDELKDEIKKLNKGIDLINAKLEEG